MDITWLFLVYILSGIAFWLLMFMVINPKIIIKRINRWMNEGNFDGILRSFMEKYGAVILGAMVDQIVNRVQMSIRGNQGVLAKQIKKAQSQISEEILSNNVPIISQIIQGSGQKIDNPMLAQLISQALQPMEQKAQNGLINAMNKLNPGENLNIPEVNPDTCQEK